MPADVIRSGPSPSIKMAITILIALALIVPIFFVWLLIYDRQQQSQTAQTSIAEGWGGPQTLAGPQLVIPYRTTREETVTEGNRQVTRQVEVWERRTIAPEAVELTTDLRPERRTRSIYEAIVYEAGTQGRARFVLPPDIQRYGIDPANLDLARAELSFYLSDPRGLGANPRVSAGGVPLRLQPGLGTGANSGSGFFAWIDGRGLASAPLEVTFNFQFRGNRVLSLSPRAGETIWRVNSSWQHPSFAGSFLPSERNVSADGFSATYRVGNLALGQPLVTSAGNTPPPPAGTETMPPDRYAAPAPAVEGAGSSYATINLVQPVDLYSQVERATKYGFLFIGFTFLALLLFDIVGGVRVAAAEYLLVGVGLILFFVLLLAFAEVIGFAGAYLISAGAITALLTFYSAAVLKSWRRAGAVATLLIILYAVLYLLLSLEAYSLLIGSVMLFGALAAVMYLTRNLNWGSTVPLVDPYPGAEQEGGAPAPAH